MTGHALNELIVRINWDTRECKGKLLVEESGREVASLQGQVSGYSKLMSFLRAEFNLKQAFVEDLLEEKLNVPDLSDAALFDLEEDCLDLQATGAWAAIETRAAERTEELKHHLLFKADNGRELDIAQGQYNAMTCYKGFFNHVQQVADNRRRANEEKGK